jgi:hypothetical protein
MEISIVLGVEIRLQILAIKFLSVKSVDGEKRKT